MEVNNKYTYIGQFNGNQKEGKGILINKSNIIVGEYKQYKLNGIGYTYDKNLEKKIFIIMQMVKKKGMEQFFMIMENMKEV